MISDVTKSPCCETLRAMANSSTWNDGDYDNNYWPLLKDTIDTVMLKEPGTYHPFSYEQVSISTF